METIRRYAISKLSWIRQQQRKLAEQERETPREYLDQESHYVWGKRYLLTISVADQRPTIELKHKRMVVTSRPGTTGAKRQEGVLKVRR